MADQSGLPLLPVYVVPTVQKFTRKWGRRPGFLVRCGFRLPTLPPSIPAALDPRQRAVKRRVAAFQ
jgi:hypothetical protein